MPNHVRRPHCPFGVNRSVRSSATRFTFLTPTHLLHNPLYPPLACPTIAAFLPGDAITLLLETIPLYVLYEASILLASFVERRERARERQMPGPGQPPDGGAPTEQRTEPSVQQIIDHTDSELS
jgi:hypothetical protein